MLDDPVMPQPFATAIAGLAWVFASQEHRPVELEPNRDRGGLVTVPLPPHRTDGSWIRRCGGFPQRREDRWRRGTHGSGISCVRLVACRLHALIRWR
jgi:hypothetical protein